MFTIQTNTQQFTEANTASRVKFLEALVTKIPQFAIQPYMNKIRSEQMSGRPGTRVITDHLRGDWNLPTGGLVPCSVEQNPHVKAQVWTAVKYAPIHEFGGDIQMISKLGKSYVIHIPKRLHLGEAWEQSFGPDMVRVINDCAAEFLR